MAFTKFTDPVDNITNQPNQPIISAVALKALFDETGKDAKDYINNVLTVELEKIADGDSGADNIGATALTGGVATTVQGIVEELDAKAISGVGALNTHKTSADHDGRYYTEAELNTGQLDTRYFTEAETTALLLANQQGNHLGTWQGYSPTLADPGISSVVAEHTRQISDLHVNVKDFGAIGNGVADDTVPIQSAINSISLVGGEVFFPDGSYKFTSQINVPNRINLKGVGMAEADAPSTDSRPTRLIKSGLFDGIVLNFASSISNMSIDGAVGNTGFGVKLNGNRARLENVCVADMGGDGVVVGDPLVDGNRNYWRLLNVTSRKNGGIGFVINDFNGGAGPDANAGYAEQCNAWTNTGDGWYLKETVVSTYVQCYSETNGGNGWNVDANAKNNTFINCGSEGNVGSQFIFKAGAVNNLSIGAFNYTPVDNGTNTIIYAVGGASQVMNLSKTLNISSDFLQQTSAITEGVKIKGNVPGFMLYETDGPATEKEWEIIANGGNLSIRTTNDSGASPVSVVTFNRDGANLDNLRVVGKIIVNGLGVTNSASATTLGTVVKKMEVFDIAGSSLGFVPIYNSIT